MRPARSFLGAPRRNVSRAAWKILRRRCTQSRLVRLVAVVLAAGCGGEPQLETVSTSRQALGCESLTDQEIFFRVATASTFIRDNAGFTPWRTVGSGRGAYQAIAAPLTNNRVFISLTSPHPECAGSLASGVASRGVLTVDGSTAHVESFWRGGGGLAMTFYAWLQLTRPFTNSQTHTITLTLPNQRGFGSVSSSTAIQAEITNPFTFMNTVYSQPRCVTCHNFVDSQALGSYHCAHSACFSREPSDAAFCINCHRQLYSYYGVSSNPLDFENAWRAPPASLGIQWSQLSPFARCSATIANLQAKGFSSYDGIRDHFHNDKRVRWAVEDGNPHDEGGSCISASSGTDECPKSWPYNSLTLEHFGDDWAFYTLINDPCGNIRTDVYPLTTLAQ